MAISVLPVLLILGFFQVKLMDHLQDHLRDAYGNSAALVCEQIASIRTVASLRRENAILAEFQESINLPVRRAMISTIKSTLVRFLVLCYPLISALCTESSGPSLYQCTPPPSHVDDILRVSDILGPPVLVWK